MGYLHAVADHSCRGRKRCAGAAYTRIGVIWVGVGTFISASPVHPFACHPTAHHPRPPPLFRNPTSVFPSPPPICCCCFLVLLPSPTSPMAHLSQTAQTRIALPPPGPSYSPPAANPFSPFRTLNAQHQTHCPLWPLATNQQAVSPARNPHAPNSRREQVQRNRPWAPLTLIWQSPPLSSNKPTHSFS